MAVEVEVEVEVEGGGGVGVVLLLLQLLLLTAGPILLKDAGEMILTVRMVLLLLLGGRMDFSLLCATKRREICRGVCAGFSNAFSHSTLTRGGVHAFFCRRNLAY